MDILQENVNDFSGRLREPRTFDCHNFLNTVEFRDYAREFSGAYVRACARVNLDPDKRSHWPLEWDKIGKFCQVFWETLPDHSMIRHGAFFKLCEFAEHYCFGDHGI
jgi:hypothetical protein